VAVLSGKNVTGTNSDDSISGTADADTLSGGDGADVISGNGGDDTISGGNGNDFLLGGAGNDILSGGNGADTLYGGRGADLLSGGTGSDILNGDFGADILTGGTSADTFYFQARTAGFDEYGAYASDVITDFSGGDRLLFSDYQPTAKLMFAQSGANTIISIDLNGDLVADYQVATVLNATMLSVASATAFGDLIV
jgi:Ca2+-binding RTX toxin-like protein